MDKKTLTITEASDMLGISRTTFYNYVLPKIQTIKVGRRQRVLMIDLQEYINKKQKNKFTIQKINNLKKNIEEALRNDKICF